MTRWIFWEPRFDETKGVKVAIVVTLKSTLFFKKVLFGYVNKAVCVMDLCAKASHCKALLAIYKGYLTLPQKILYCPPSSSDMEDCCWKSFFFKKHKKSTLFA